MSDYLGNLAAKALHQTESVQPRLASHFEPLPGTSGAMPGEVFGLEAAREDPFAEETIATPTGTIRRSSHRAQVAFSPDDGQQMTRDTGAAVSRQTPQTVVQPPSPAGAAQANEQETEPVRRAPSPAFEPPQALSATMPDAPPEMTPSVARGAWHPSRMEPSAQPTPNHDRQVHVDEPAVTRQGAAPRPITTSSPTPPTPAPAVAQPQITSYREAPEPVSIEHAVAADAGPTIRVSIGRVEVRAIMPPPPSAPRTKPARRGPTLSLDGYLQRRNGGQR
jgi:hypothetical protein